MSQTAILIDFENLIIGIENNDPDAQKTFSIKKILQFIDKTYGHVVFKKAFADWSNQKFRKYAQDLMKNGFEMQHIVRSSGYANKNFTESHMTIAAMDSIIRNPMIDCIVLATGDADFLPLIDHLKAMGRLVVGIGAEGTVAANVLTNCDDYLYYAQDGLYKAHIPTFDKAGVFKLLRNIIGNTGIYVADIEDELMAQCPDFSLDELGFNNIVDLLQSMPNAVRLDDSGDELKAFWITPATRPAKLSREEIIQEQLALPLDEYMRATRWYITDGPTRESILNNIFNTLSTAEHLISSEDLREMTASGDLAVDDKAWQGTIFSLVCGSCLWEKPEGNDVPLQMRKLSLFKSIENLEDFMLGYYISLFYKAFLQRQDLNPQTMAELMHPESPETHLELFEKVCAEINSRNKA